MRLVLSIAILVLCLTLMSGNAGADVLPRDEAACQNKKVGETCGFISICQKGQRSRTRIGLDGSVVTNTWDKSWCVLRPVRTALPIDIGLWALGLGVFLARRLGRHDAKGAVEIPHTE